MCDQGDLKVLVTGAAGQIAYSLMMSIAKGDVFGTDKRITMVLLDIPFMAEALKGVEMELQDCALPNLKEVIATTDYDVAFKDIDVAILVGAMPRREGMERKDLLKANAKIFSGQGKALEKSAKKTVKVVVVGNPANTNCKITMDNAPSIPRANFSALTRLDQNRAQSQIAMRLGVACNDVSNVIIWGNHSSTQYPDVAHASVVTKDKKVVKVPEAVKDDAWLNGDFITTVQKRGGAVLAARKLSSAMSASKAICDHVRDWWFGTPEGKWTSMAVVSDEKKYGIPPGVIYSYPVTIKNGNWTIVDGLPISDFARNKMDATANELVQEAEDAKSALE